MKLIEPYVPESMRYKTEIFMRECPICGEKFPKSNHECCSPACTQLIRKERKREYANRTHDHRLEKARIWCMAHREDINTAAREAYKKMSPEQRETLNARARAYRERNHERYREKRRNYYARVKNDPHFMELRKGENTRHYQRVKEDPIRYEHRLMLQRQRRKNPEAHVKEMEAQRRHRAILNADPVKKAARLERDRLARKKYMQNPAVRAKAKAQRLERYRRKMEALRKDPVAYAAHLEKARSWKRNSHTPRPETVV